MCTTNKKSVDHEQTLKLEDILLRYLTFYCNLAETIVNELKQESDNNTKSWLNHPIPYRQGALYFELFDHVSQTFIFIRRGKSGKNLFIIGDITSKNSPYRSEWPNC
jgi:hypothetical protein